MKPDNRDLLVVAAAAPVCAALALAVPVAPVRILAAVPLCLVLPGYALTAAIFARREISGLQYSLLALALSLSTLVLGSLVLDLSPGGIRSGTWARAASNRHIGGLRSGPEATTVDDQRVAAPPRK